MKNIYVGNISFQTTEQDIEQAFSAYGQVERVQIVKDRESGQSRGFGFVEMSDNNDADKAVAALELQIRKIHERNKDYARETLREKIVNE